MTDEVPVPSAQHDWFIQSLVNVSNVAPLSFGVTLQVSGLLVSGYLVSGKAYFEAVGQQIIRGVAQNAALAVVLVMLVGCALLGVFVMLSRL